jgi:hypothetical protein
VVTPAGADDRDGDEDHRADGPAQGPRVDRRQRVGAEWDRERGGDAQQRGPPPVDEPHRRRHERGGERELEQQRHGDRDLRTVQRGERRREDQRRAEPGEAAHGTGEQRRSDRGGERPR